MVDIADDIVVGIGITMDVAVDMVVDIVIVVGRWTLAMYVMVGMCRGAY